MFAEVLYAEAGGDGAIFGVECRGSLQGKITPETEALQKYL